MYQATLLWTASILLQLVRGDHTMAAYSKSGLTWVRYASILIFHWQKCVFLLIKARINTKTIPLCCEISMQVLLKTM